jgi:hypothetical protein
MVSHGKDRRRVAKAFADRLAFVKARFGRCHQRACLARGVLVSCEDPF